MTTLTVRRVGSVPASVLTPAAALDRAMLSLKQWRAKVTRDDDRGILRFKATFLSGRSWLSAVMNAQVSATTQGGSTVVEVSASIAPLVIMCVAMSALASVFISVFGVLFGIIVLGGNYAFVHFGMERLLTETLP